jgi:hypothetical protein
MNNKKREFFPNDPWANWESVHRDKKVSSLAWNVYHDWKCIVEVICEDGDNFECVDSDGNIVEVENWDNVPVDDEVKEWTEHYADTVLAMANDLGQILAAAIDSKDGSFFRDLATVIEKPQDGQCAYRMDIFKVAGYCPMFGQRNFLPWKEFLERIIELGHDKSESLLKADCKALGITRHKV